MFTGIIETTATVKEVISNGSGLTAWLESNISAELRVDQSLSHDGVCLTVEETNGSAYRVTAVAETLEKTNLSGWVAGKIVNLERSLRVGDRLDGHLVQGHVDTTGICTKRKEKKGSWEFDFSFPKKFAEWMIEKGSVAVNGTSLTAYNVDRKSFRVAIIPYTFEHTSIRQVNPGDSVNIEFDLVGKYLARKHAVR